MTDPSSCWHLAEEQLMLRVLCLVEAAAAGATVRLEVGSEGALCCSPLRLALPERSGEVERDALGRRNCWEKNKFGKGLGADTAFVLQKED